MYNKNYLSKRPFMVITCRFKPAQGARTEKAGWADKAGWDVAEEVVMVDRVTRKHETYATLVVDLLEATVVLNRFQNATKEDAMQHFMAKYKKEISEAISVWMEREANKMARSGKFDITADATESETPAA